MLLLLTHRLHCCMEYIGSSTISIIDRMVLYISNHVTALWNLMGFSTRQAADQPSNYMSVPTQNTQASMQERSITSIRTSVSREHAACLLLTLEVEMASQLSVSSTRKVKGSNSTHSYY